MKIGAIIQARMGSTRFPEKILKCLNEKTVLEHIIKRTQDSDVDICIVATTSNERDDVVEELCEKNNIPCFRGSESDVLERFYQCAEAFQLDVIVRITADDPLKDTGIINKAIALLVNNNYDYVSNTIKPTYPEGIDVEVFTFEALKKTYREASLPSEHEHVTPYIWKNDNIFNVYNFENDINLSDMRWTMDTQDDFEFMKRVYSNFAGKDNFSMEDVLKYVSDHPEVSQINQGHVRNAGYIKSIEEERK